MESEADLGDGQLSAHIGTRRRSASISDDYSVQKTNDDATECKYAAVKLGYYNDEYLSRFVLACGEHAGRRDPEISRGYWARITAIKMLVESFIQQAGSSCQIINIGCGFDTLYWRLKEGNYKFAKFIDIDFSSVTAKKIRQIRKPGKPDLVKLFSEQPKEERHADLHAGDYHLIGADLRQPHELKSKLESTEVDFSAPTLFIAECVLVYMGVKQSNELLAELACWFGTAVFVNYEQVAVSDSFGKVMEVNLHQRGILLPGLAACENLESQKKRFTDNNWERVEALTMREIYDNHLPRSEIQRIEQIELLDERELLTQLLDHYCLVIACKDSTSNYAILGKIPFM